MGLDQYAYIKHDDGAHDERAYDFVWRKHSKLQAWAETLFTAKTGQPAEKLNCAELVLEATDIAALETLVRHKALPKSTGGFFFGHQFQDEAAGETYSIFWKIDLYDLAYNIGSDDPANVDATRRVLTVLHASEY
jgi:hypothetical protein